MHITNKNNNNVYLIGVFIQEDPEIEPFPGVAKKDIATAYQLFAGRK